MSLLKLASLLAGEVRSWAALLLVVERSVDELGVDVMDRPVLTSDDGEPLVSTGYALVRLLEACGKLEDLHVSIGNLWPDRKPWAEDQRVRYAPLALVPWLAQPAGSDVTFPIMTWLLNEIGREREVSGWEAVYDALWRRRAVWATACMAKGFAPGVQDALAVHWILSQPASAGSAGGAEEKCLAAAVRGYMRADGLFRWMVYQSHFDSGSAPEWNPYRLLFQASSPEGIIPVISKRETDQDGEGVVDIIKAIIGVDHDTEGLADIIAIVRRLQEAIMGGGYDQILDAVCEDSSLYGPDSIIVSRHPVNVIPASMPGACSPMLVAFSAHKKRRKIAPLADTLRKVREHLIRCVHVTKTVILVMDDWNPNAFTESCGDLAAHRKNGTIFVPLLINGNQLVPMMPPF